MCIEPVGIIPFMVVFKFSVCVITVKTYGSSGFTESEVISLTSGKFENVSVFALLSQSDNLSTFL